MLRQLSSFLRGVIAILGYVINTLFWTMLLFITALLRWLIPWHHWRAFYTRIMHWLPDCWIDGNTWVMKKTLKTPILVEGTEQLKLDEWYLMIANHQSWADILILQSVFNHKIPLLKFFLKKELLWTLPFAGWACWLLDFPFMERHSKTSLAKHPELRRQDIETTRKACEKFKHMPTTIINFIEGTRFTREKQKKTQSPYRYLLRPRAAGIAFVLATMGDTLHQILNVTVVYANAPTTAWQFFCGTIPQITVHVETLPITPDLLGDYENDRQHRVYFQRWLNQLWQTKDEFIAGKLQ